MTLTGYIRSDGRVGFRNYLVVMPLVGCMSGIAQHIAAELPGAVPLIHSNGCELCSRDSEWVAVQMERLASHPNVGSALFITMACGSMNRFGVPKRTEKNGRIIEVLNFHSTGGTAQVVKRGVELGKKLLEKLNTVPREPVPMSGMVLGTKCGSSDPTSAEVLHPVTGAVCDRIVDEGGTVVLGENFELIFDIEGLAARAVNPRVGAEIMAIREHVVREYSQRSGQTPKFDDDARVMSASRAAKAGTRPIQEVVPLDGTISGPGLVVYDGPNSDLVSVTTMSGAGCNLLLFTTGRGTPVGGVCSPAIKVTANSKTGESMAGNIDAAIGDVTEGKASAAEGAERIYKTVMKIANGRLSKSEDLGHFEMQFHIRGIMF